MAHKRDVNGGPLRAGNAGVIAAFVVALAATVLGAGAAYIGEFGAVAAASRDVDALQTRIASLPIANAKKREKIVRAVIDRFPLERFAAPEIVIRESAIRPKIIVVLDDIGLDRAATDAALSLPGPITYSVLPYAPNVEKLAASVAAGEGDLMLHLPMEPHGHEDPGPNALRTSMSPGVFFRALEWNLSRFDNYVGVNNHMGSKLTANRAAMTMVLQNLKHRDLFFIDSVTDADSVAYEIGAQIGAKALRRDVFLDPAPGDGDLVRRQIRLAEQIALETGYVVAIGHPRPETLDVLGPWLATAEARGFELTTPSALFARDAETRIAAAPELRY